MTLEIIQNNYVAVVITLLLILFILTNNNFEKRINHLFLLAANCILILIVEETWEAQLALGSVYNPLRVILSAIGYSLRPAIPYILFIIMKRSSKKTVALMGIPLIFNTAIAFSAIFCKLSFWYTPDNQFVRGPLGMLPFIVAAFYIIILLALIFRQCRKGSYMEGMVIAAMVLLAFASTVIESVLHVQFIQNPSIATCVTYFYLFLHSNQNNRDSLTGAMTRRRFYLDAKKYNNVLSAIISLDLNDLKKLNDQYGHIEGDKALVTVTDIIMKYMSTRASLYRIGGDEFMILCYKLSEKQVLEIIDKIRGDLEKSKYRCAIGYSLYSSDLNFDYVCQRADHMMYENKWQMKNQ